MRRLWVICWQCALWHSDHMALPEAVQFVTTRLRQQLRNQVRIVE